MAAVVAFVAALIAEAIWDIGVPYIVADAIAYVAANVIVYGALAAASTLLAPRPKVPRPDDGRIPFRQPTPPRQSGFGRYRCSGPYMCFEVDAKANSVDVIAIHDGQIDAFERYFLHEDEITRETNHLGGDVVSSMNNNVYATCNIDTRVGLPTETPFSEATTLLGPGVFGAGRPAIWPTTARGDGIASLMLVSGAADQDWFQRRYPNGLPLPSVVIRAQLVYDWRDATQSLADRSTWKWSENAIVCLAAYLTYAPGGMGFDFATRIQPALSMWTAAANVCDEAVPLAAGGTEPRYTLGGMYRHDNDPADVIAVLLAAMDGWFGETGDGSIAVYAGKYAAPTLTIGAEHIVGYSVQRYVPDSEACNELVIRYCSPDHRYTLVEAQSWIDTADQEARGRTVNRTAELGWVTSHAQARRLAKREVSRANMELRGTVSTDLYGLQAFGQRYVALDLSELPNVGLINVEVRKIALDLARGGVQIDWIAVDPNIDAWDPLTEEGSPPPVPPVPVQQGAPVPANVAAGAVYVTAIGGAGSDGVHIQVSWDLSARTDLGFRVQYRLTDVGGGTPGTWITQSIASSDIDRSQTRLTFNTNFVQTNTSYDVQVASVAGSGAVSDYSTPITVSTSDSAIAPAPPTDVTATGGAGQATISWVNPTSVNFASAKVYRAASGADFSTATAVSGSIAGGAGAAKSYTDTGVAAGTYSYWVVAYNSGGVPSSPTGPATATVT